MPLTSSKTLPSFRQPPVTEVVLSVQIVPLPNFQAAHFGMFWDCIRAEYPSTDTKPPIDAQTEFEEIGKANVSLQILPSMPMPRAWYLNADQTRLVQIQPDRIVFNWQQRDSAQEYPRFPSILDDFLRAYDKFEAFVKAHELGDFTPVQAEVSYINQLPLNDQVTTFGDLGSVFRFWSRPTSEFLGTPEHANLQMAFRIQSDEQFRGRLHVTVEPRFRRGDNARLLQLTMVARGPVLTGDRAGAREFLELGRQYVVHGFADLTTPTLQKIWERIDG